MTISCGCVGKKLFEAYYEVRAANLSARLQTEIFEAASRWKHWPRNRFLFAYIPFNRRFKRMIAWLAKRFKLSRYVLSAVINAKRKILKDLIYQAQRLADAAYHVGLRTVDWMDLPAIQSLSKVSWKWVYSYSRVRYRDNDVTAKSKFLESLPWRQKLIYAASPWKEIDWSMPVAGYEAAIAARAEANRLAYRDPVSGTISESPLPVKIPSDYLFVGDNPYGARSQMECPACPMLVVSRPSSTEACLTQPERIDPGIEAAREAKIEAEDLAWARVYPVEAAEYQQARWDGVRDCGM
jgi:hypothetical protein